MSDNRRTVRVHFAGFVDLYVDSDTDVAVLASEAARDVEYELKERWSPQEDGSSCLAERIDERPLATVRPVIGRTQKVEDLLSVLLAKVKQWETVDGEWVDVRDQYRDEYGDETDPDALDKLITTQFFQKFWDASEELKCEAASLLSALPPIPQSAN
ncbi:hypothetical protein [Streptomyces sp. NPDC057253]|uniref:hypothetical protein n=1 Tax=Streptomyces sp. NPDC057253 TaxID=3346069 RepID=UPI003645CA9C